MNKYLKKDLNDLRVEKIIDKYIEKNESFVYQYYANNIDIYQYIRYGKNEQQTLYLLDKFCSAIHSALLRKIENAVGIRDYIIFTSRSGPVNNDMRRRYCKIVMIILKYRTFFVYFLSRMTEIDFPYLDKKKLFLKNGNILLKSSKRIIRHHLIVLNFFKDYLSANDFNFIVNLACSKNNIKLVEFIINNFQDKLNDYQKSKLNSIQVFFAIND